MKRAFADLNYYEPFNRELTCGHPDRLKRSIDLLWPEIKAHAGLVKEHHRFQEHLSLILINLLHCHRVAPDMLVGFSASPNYYSKQLPDGFLSLKYESMLHNIHALTDLDYVDCRTGTFDRSKSTATSKGTGKTSRMRATAKLIDFIRLHSGNIHIRNRMGGPMGAIVMKDANKKRIEFKQDREFLRMRDNLHTINGRISQSFIGLFVTEQHLADMMVRMRKKRSVGPGRFRKTLNFGKKTLVRVFNNGSFSDGGRFYGPWWQSIPKVDRKFIRIDDKVTCEVDFSGMHVAIMYADEGLQVPEGDVYELDGFSADARHTLKKIFNTLINAKNITQAVRSIRRNYPRDKHPELFSDDSITPQSIISAFKEKHKAISKHFCTGHGVKLQRKDSQIAEGVQLQLGEKGIVALPVHDSYIVQEIHKQELEDAMRSVTRAIYNQDFKFDDDGTPYDKDRAVIQREFPEEDISKAIRANEDSTRDQCTTYTHLKSVWSQPII